MHEPITKEEFERELERLALVPGEAESQREFRMLCDVFEALDNMHCRPPQWLLPKLEEVHVLTQLDADLTDTIWDFVRADATSPIPLDPGGRIRCVSTKMRHTA